MSWTAAEFLDLIHQRGIMAADHVDDLRDQLAAAGCQIHVVHVARKLVEAGYLNPYFAKTLLEEGYRHGTAAATFAPPRQKSRSVSSDDEELDLAPLEEEQRQEQAALAEGPPIELRIELPPIQDPDDWPIRSDGTQLPPVSSQVAFEPLSRGAIRSHAVRRSELTWLNLALGGLALLLLALVILLLISK